jgi:hypothetical protein
VETRSHTDNRLAISAKPAHNVKSAHTGVIFNSFITAARESARRPQQASNRNGHLRRREQIKTPTDAKRPAGVISLIGGYGGTPSHKSFNFSGGAKLGKRESSWALWG